MAAPQYRGEHDAAEDLASFIESTDMVKSDSMDIKNDPRFFQGNIIQKRLAAFATMAVVSGLLLQNCMDQMFDMDKNMQIWGGYFHANGCIQFVAFLMLLVIFFANILATYISVAQPYHTIRLMTAGPTGFEAAASYYLNRNIVAWRHLSIKYLLWSLPLYISQMGIRLVVKFDRTTMDSAAKSRETPMHSLVQGIFFSICMLILCCTLWSTHKQHFDIFRERYEVMSRKVTGGDFDEYLTKRMASGRAGMLDV